MTLAPFFATLQGGKDDAQADASVEGGGAQQGASGRTDDREQTWRDRLITLVD
jgi:hypothetical protein